MSRRTRGSNVQNAKAPRKKKSRRAFRATALVLVTGLLAGALAMVLLSRDSASADRSAVRTYEEKIRPLAVDGGRIVQQEIKPRLTDLRQGTVTAQQFGSEAQNWLNQFQRIRREFAAVAHPDRLNETATLYDRALAGYIRSIQAFIEAATKVNAAERDALLSRGADAAEQADNAYDRARETLAKEMKEVGLDPSVR